MTSIAVCRKCKGGRALADHIEEQTGTSVERVRCQSICKGPVVGLDVHGRMEWFRKVRGPKTTAALVRLVQRKGRGKVGRRLQARRLPKRSGRDPRRDRRATS